MHDILYIKLMTDLNPLLTALATGRFNRVSLRETLEGLRLSDVVGAQECEFVASLQQKDQLIGRAFWRSLQPVFAAYTGYEAFLNIRREVDASKTALVQAITAVQQQEPVMRGNANPNT